MNRNNINKLQTQKRIGVFFLYDPHGIADNSVLYFLEQSRSHFQKLIIVVNGLLTSDSKKSLAKIADDILVRENKGFDVWAYKTAIDFLGWKQIEQYDELTLFNFTNFGPLYPFKEMFDSMDKSTVDFWGITKHHGHSDINIQIEEHIQSHWISIRKSMFSSNTFKDYWKNLPEINSYDESVQKHEAIFTKKFENENFKWDIYVNTDSLKEYSENPLLDMPLNLVRDYRSPIIKKKSFAIDYSRVMIRNSGENLRKAFEYIKNNLDYNVDFIWDNILRLYNYADVKQNLHLNYVLPSNFLIESNSKNSSSQKVALIIHIYFTDLIDYCFKYAKSIPQNADVYITTDSKEKKDSILKVFSKLKCNKLEVRVIKNRGRDVGALLVGCKDIILKYDLICFAHDKKTSQVKPLSVGESFSFRCWESVLENNKFVQNIIRTFEENKKLGLLFSPPIYHGGMSCDKWGLNFKQVKNLADDLKINVSIENNKQPIAPYGTIFWFRSEALKTLIQYNWQYEDLPKEPNKFDGTIIHAIERLYPYVAQHNGYYSAWSMSEEFASMEIENLFWFYQNNSISVKIKSIFRLYANYVSENYPTIFKIIAPFYRFIRAIFRFIYKKKKG